MAIIWGLERYRPRPNPLERMRFRRVFPLAKVGIRILVSESLIQPAKMMLRIKRWPAEVRAPSDPGSHCSHGGKGMAIWGLERGSRLRARACARAAGQSLPAAVAVSVLNVEIHNSVAQTKMFSSLFSPSLAKCRAAAPLGAARHFAREGEKREENIFEIRHHFSGFLQSQVKTQKLKKCT